MNLANPHINFHFAIYLVVISIRQKHFCTIDLDGRPIENFDHNVPCCSEKLEDNDSEGILWHSGHVELHNEGKKL
jgi:hypothetical protein